MSAVLPLLCVVIPLKETNEALTDANYEAVYECTALAILVTRLGAQSPEMCRRQSMTAMLAGLSVLFPT